MPTEHVHVTYNFDELSTTAQDKALAEVADHLAGAWWNSSDNDDIAETMLFTLAREFKSPGYDDYGPADFPGIEGLTVEEWDIERGTYKLGGCLTPTTAPALPWKNGPAQFNFNRDGSSYLDWGDLEYDDSYTDKFKSLAYEGFDKVIRDAIAAALKAGAAEVEYKISEEYAREWIDGNDPQFNEDGTLH